MKKYTINGEEWTYLTLSDFRGREKDFLQGAWISGIKISVNENSRNTWLQIFQLKTHEFTSIVLHDSEKGVQMTKEARNLALENDLKIILSDK